MKILFSTDGAQGRAKAGYSLVELIVTVAVLGILSGIMMRVFVNVKSSSSDIIANEVMETVNLGVKKFDQVGYKITTTADANSTVNEEAIVALLQTRDVTIPGSPFVQPDWDPTGSDDAADYRIRWAGRTFELLKPGTAGHGLRVDFEAGDYN